MYARSSEAGEAERDATDGERSETAHETSCETPCETCSKINREAGGERIVVAINPSNTDASCTLPSDYVKLLSGGLAQEISQEPAEKTVLLSIGNPARFDGTQLHVPARSATILQNRTLKATKTRKGRSAELAICGTAFTSKQFQDCATLRPLASISPSIRRKIQL